MSSESKPVAETTTMAKNISAYLLDIEGTTTSISFVKVIKNCLPFVCAGLGVYQYGGCIR
jgi:hypothetical protein